MQPKWFNRTYTNKAVLESAALQHSISVFPMIGSKSYNVILRKAHKLKSIFWIDNLLSSHKSQLSSLNIANIIILQCVQNNKKNLKSVNMTVLFVYLQRNFGNHAGFSPGKSFILEQMFWFDICQFVSKLS